MDFAGGTAVHITSGTTVAAFVAFQAINDTMQRRHSRAPRTPQPAILNRDAPYSVSNMVLGTAFLWIGWFGFNGGSALGGNMRAVSACVSTHFSACAGGCSNLLLLWLLNFWAARQARDRQARERQDRATQDSVTQDIALEDITIQDTAAQDTATLDKALQDIARLDKALQDIAKPWYPEKSALSITHFCDGVIIGLVCITPGAGFVCHASLIHESPADKIEGPCLELYNLRHCRRSYCFLPEKTR
jgi:hypothetical protein